MTNALPEVGQVVKVRDRHWAVSEIMRSGLPPDILRSGGDPSSTLGDLKWVEDDGQGETLTVAWECEPGTAVLEASALPSMPNDGKFDSPEILAAFLNAIRWGAVISADTRSLQAPFRSRITLEDYQFEKEGRFCNA